ncbi:hypothetical protein LTR17_009902 [Elasticomyces elasticus]|nr:hypothetical protein LTR17_009902 [Elasticomyces elasticus]
MAAPPKKMGLSLYANLLDPSKPDSATATISSAPVRYDDQNAKQGGAIDEAQKRKDAALQFQPVRRPAVASKKDGAKKMGGKGGHMFSSSTTSASVVDSSAVGSTPSVQRSNFEDWVGDEDEDSFFLENRDKPKPERGGRKNKKKKGGKGEAVVATRSWSWDDVYDPSMPNNYADYKGSEEQVMEIRDWKARLYYHRVKGGKKNAFAAQETVKKAAVNSMFAPPASLSFAPPSFDQTPTKPAPPLGDDDDEYYPPSVPSRLPDTSDSYEPPPAFSTPVQPRPISMDPRRAAMPPPPPPVSTPVLPTPPVISADAAAAIAAKKAEAAAKIAAFKAKVEAHKAAKAAAENGGIAAVTTASEVPATPALPVAQPVVSEPVHALPLPPPLPPPPAAEEQEPGATISRAPVRYTAPPATETLPTAVDVEAEAEEEARSNRPGQKGFAERLLKKYGWEKGKGLGAQGNEGITTAIVAKAEKRKKLADAEGGGWAKPANMGKLVGGKRRKVGDGGGDGEGEGEMSSVVRLSNMLRGLDVEVEVGEKDLYGEIGREMEGEYGKVERVFIWRRSREDEVEKVDGGVVGDGGEEGGDEVFVKFVSPLSALRAVGGCEGMEFAGNVVQARFWGVEDFEEGRYEYKRLSARHNTTNANPLPILFVSARAVMAAPSVWTLLTLPPEMRNRIYREVLNGEDIRISSSDRSFPIEPAILRTCRQARNEALAIYYKENTFVFRIYENDARNLIKFCKLSLLHKDSETDFEVASSRNWKNLMVWAAAIFRDECTVPMLMYPDGDTAVPAAFHVLEVASQLKKCGVVWPAAEAVLGQMRMAMAAENFAWRYDLRDQAVDPGGGRI